MSHDTIPYLLYGLGLTFVALLGLLEWRDRRQYERLHPE